MKKFIITFIIIVLYSSIYSQNLKIIQSDYANSYKSPIIVHKGDTIISYCDTLYLINNLRYSFYKKLHNQLIIDTISLLKEIIKTWENDIEQQKKAYEILKENINKNDLITEDLIKYSKEELEKTQSSLKKIENNLDKSLKSMKKASKKIQKTKDESFKNKILIFSSGTLVGIIIGLFIN